MLDKRLLAGKNGKVLGIGPDFIGVANSKGDG
jgi:hypothetical protein